MNTNECGVADHPDSLPSLYLLLLFPLYCSGQAVSVSSLLLHVAKVSRKFEIAYKMAEFNFGYSNSNSPMIQVRGVARSFVCS